MENIIIDEEFRELLPPLDKDTYKALEENMLANGCLYPLVTWKGILIDGHNRHSICTKHGIPFETVEKEFASREDVIIWIISNQVARRNLTPIQLTYFRGLHYNTVKGKGGNSKGKNQHSEVGSNFSNQPQALKTVDLLSKQYKVHRGTIVNDAKASVTIDAIGKVSSAAKEKILSGDVPIDKQELRKLSTASEEEIKAVAAKIENGTYNKRDASGGDSPHLSVTIPQNPSAILSNKKKRALTPKTLEGLVISGVTNAQYNELLNTAKSGDPMKVKRALTAYIDTLVVLFRQL